MSAPYSIQFTQNSKGEIIEVLVQVMTGFMKPNNFVRLSSIPNFSTLEEFEAVVLDSMPEKAIAKKFPTEQSKLDAVEQEVLSSEVHAKIIELLQTPENAQLFADLLAANADTYYMEFCNQFDLIPPRLKELWGIVVSESLNTDEPVQE